jgi:hypothetical protein
MENDIFELLNYFDIDVYNFYHKITYFILVE